MRNSMMRNMYGVTEKRELLALFRDEIENISTRAKGKVEKCLQVSAMFAFAMYAGYEPVSCRNNRVAFRRVVQNRFGEAVADRVFPLYKKIKEPKSIVVDEDCRARVEIAKLEEFLLVEPPLARGLKRADANAYARVAILALQGCRTKEILSDITIFRHTKDGDMMIVKNEEKHTIFLLSSKKNNILLKEIRQHFEKKRLEGVGDVTRAIRYGIGRFGIAGATNINHLNRIYEGCIDG